MKRDRWNVTGWCLLPGTLRYPEAVLHRPDPDRSGYVMCDRKSDGGQGFATFDTTYKECGGCTRAIGAARTRIKREKRAAARLVAQAQAAKDAVLRRQHNHAGSIRAVSAGLPGLGRR